MLCGREFSVRGENLVTGNTKGCGCDRNYKISTKRHENGLNKYEYSNEMHCWVGYANNTGNPFYIDDNDYETVSRYSWYETSYGYLMTRLSVTEQIFMHRLIMFGLDSKNNGIYIDHINRERRDNRKINLRACTIQENTWNKASETNTKSGVRGVSWYEPGNKWRAYIGIDSRTISLGYYNDLDEAIKARKEAEKKYWGEFAPV